ncbi:related to CDC24 - Guanine nucleotide exchange factor (GEF or GDP-release factor) [Melanopsichium pennsylvanicum]|uniref:Related to CDC24 - Guanine nucleotide exchange factor (GEF or GDP-release factor) n=2 Tax=Melanopsichium pennsylvanicum TaxID=63383 RepID=A0AAJ4XLF1_9BASI|nr:von willebrand ring finger domain-containing protein [Melanopsichium pennsylvanicum 4]SNX83906.1 related to CDC24 - Guanine nucleotide exchange factor (GEF or GDP-release factor) [Melanopsichium pennsylvanicum]
MGLFDVGSLRVRKLSSNKDLSNSEAHALRRQNDNRLAANLGIYKDSRNGASTRSLSANQASTFDAPPAGLSAKRSVSGMTPRDTARQTKLERMMGAGVPQIQVVRRQDHGAPSAFVEQPPAFVDSNHHRNQHFASAMRSPAIIRTKSVSEMSEAHSSYSRAFSSDLSNTVGGATTFTEMSEVDCPVCLEPLSHRLAGEKPHVVPICGHALHNACFTAIYGPPEALLAALNPGSRLRGAAAGSRHSVGPPGMCGVCRKPIALGEANAIKSNKLTGIKGLATDSPKLRSTLSFTNDDEVQQAHNDDPIETTQSLKRGNTISSAASFSSTSSNSQTLPTIRARPEFTTIYAKPNGKQNGKLNVVSVLSIDVPSRRSPFEIRDHALDTISDEYAQDNGTRDDDSYSDDLKRSGSGWDANSADGPSAAPVDRSRSPMPDARVGFTEQGDKQNIMARTESPEDQGFSFGATPAGLPALDPTRAILNDLQQRVADWKGHSIEHFGPLILHDLLNIRQDSVIREFHVYLFQEALLCVTEERRKGLGRFISNGAVGGAGASEVETGKPALKLKGRIYLRHIRRVLDSSVAGEHSLSITMDDENLDQFVLCFRETGTMDIWQSRLKELTEWMGASPALPAAPEASAAPSTVHNSTVRRSPVAQTLSESGHKQAFTTDVVPTCAGLNPHRPAAGQPLTSGAASVLSGKSGSHHGMQCRNSRRISGVSSSHQSNHGPASHRISASSDTAPFYQQWSSSGGLDPRVPPPSMLPHSPIDLVLMISVPSVLPENISGSISSSAALKLRLIRSTLDFIIHSLGPNDRVSLVAFTVGIDCEVKRTGLLSPNRDSSRLLLEEFVQNIGRPWDSADSDPFTVDLSKLGGSSERIDTVTAVNVGLDVVLGRKAKNPVTSMMLINDTSDGPKRNQMDLVMARAEAANVAIHCFGYGKTHDPSSLWLISNHTRGSYTFVREWYQLRECLAGCLGSMMSVALTDVKVHIGVPHDNCFRIRKMAGLPGAIISSSGKDVDIDMGEIKFGEAKDLLVELELDLASLLPTLLENRRDSKSIGPGPIELGSATDDFMQRMGIQDLSLADSDGAEGFVEQMVEEIGVFEADVSFKDPATGLITSRLPNPGILTLEVDMHSTDPLTNGPPGLAAVVAEPTVTRRRLEVLVSEMMTRSLLLISRKNYGQALRVITETRRIIDTVVQALNGPNQSKRRSLIVHRSNQRKVREAANQRTISSLMAMMSDLDVLSEGLEHQHRSSFDRDGRNFGAQQAMILRDQKGWTTRTDTEFLYFRDDNAASYTAWSASFASMR